jgi:hypothetical protein
VELRQRAVGVAVRSPVEGEEAAVRPCPAGEGVAVVPSRGEEEEGLAPHQPQVAVAVVAGPMEAVAAP